MVGSGDVRFGVVLLGLVRLGWVLVGSCQVRYGKVIFQSIHAHGLVGCGMV